MAPGWVGSWTSGCWGRGPRGREAGGPPTPTAEVSVPQEQAGGATGRPRGVRGAARRQVYICGPRHILVEFPGKLSRHDHVKCFKGENPDVRQEKKNKGFHLPGGFPLPCPHLPETNAPRFPADTGVPRGLRAAKAGGVLSTGSSAHHPWFPARSCQPGKAPRGKNGALSTRSFTEGSGTRQSVELSLKYTYETSAVL